MTQEAKIGHYFKRLTMIENTSVTPTTTSAASPTRVGWCNTLRHSGARVSANPKSLADNFQIPGLRLAAHPGMTCQIQGITNNEKHPVRSHRKSRHHHRLQPRHRPFLRRAARQTRRQGRDLQPQGGRLSRGRQRHQQGRRRRQFIPCNISRREEVEALVAGTTKHYGKVDILVCNAAVNPYYGPLLDIKDEAFDKIMGSNVKATSGSARSRSRRWPSAATARWSSSRPSGACAAPPYRRLRHFKAADFALCRSLAGEWPKGHPRQLRSTRPGQDRFRQGALGRPGTLKRRTAAPRSGGSANPTKSQGRWPAWPPTPQPS